LASFNIASIIFLVTLCRTVQAWRGRKFLKGFFAIPANLLVLHTFLWSCIKTFSGTVLAAATIFNRFSDFKILATGKTLANKAIALTNAITFLRTILAILPLSYPKFLAASLADGVFLSGANRTLVRTKPLVIRRVNFKLLAAMFTSTFVLLLLGDVLAVTRAKAAKALAKVVAVCLELFTAHFARVKDGRLAFGRARTGAGTKCLAQTGDFKWLLALGTNLSGHTTLPTELVARMEYYGATWYGSQVIQAGCDPALAPL